MGHFARVVNGKVDQVIVAEPEFFDTFVDTSPGQWLQTSYRTHGNQHPEGAPLRGNFAGIGYLYDPLADIFYAPQPYPSWVLESALWVAPVAKPEGDYAWDESTVSWKVKE